MNDIILFFFFGGILFLILFIVILYFSKKLSKLFEKKYIPETATSFKCIDGHKVRSKAELVIDNYLYNHNVSHEYERKIKINGNSLLCDWFLPDSGIYIEYWGYYGKDYMKRKEEKIRLYKKGNLKLISVEDIMFTDIYKNLDEILGKYIQLDGSKKKHCPNCGIALDDRF
jgi:predicted nuclease of restriction endonuclease-like RecB superfamily